MRDCFTKDPAERPTAQQLLNHRWLKEAFRSSAREEEWYRSFSLPTLRRFGFLIFDGVSIGVLFHLYTQFLSPPLVLAL